jgi:hypothetical protein
MMMYTAFVWPTLAFFEVEGAPIKELYFSDLPVTPAPYNPYLSLNENFTMSGTGYNHTINPTSATCR